jgi:hypothetical protein
MADNNVNGPVPRVVEGTGFYTPMDLAPGEAPTGANTPQASPASEKLSIGLPTSMDMTTADPAIQQPPAQSPQPGNDNSVAGA